MLPVSVWGVPKKAPMQVGASANPKKICVSAQVAKHTPLLAIVVKGFRWSPWLPGDTFRTGRKDMSTE